MASNDKNPQEEENRIESLNSHLTSAGEKLADNKKIIYWAVGAVVAIGAVIAGYIFLYKNPHQSKSYEAYNQVEMDTQGNDSLAAVKYLEVAKKYGSSDGGNLASLSAGEAFYKIGRAHV